MYEPEREDFAPLCDRRGWLDRAAISWSRFPLHTCNLVGRFPHRKSWDQVALRLADGLLELTLARFDWLGLVEIAWTDSRGRRLRRRLPLPGSAVLLGHSAIGTASIEVGRAQVRFEKSIEQIRVGFSLPGFGSEGLQGQITVPRPHGQESLNTVIPWGDRFFCYLHGDRGLVGTGQVSGTVRHDGPLELDYEVLRGVLPHTLRWSRLQASSGVGTSERLALQLGAGWTDGTGMTENAVLRDGVLDKLSEPVAIEAPLDPLAPWEVLTPRSERLQARFLPHFQNRERGGLFGIGVRERLWQGRLVGRLDGAAIDLPARLRVGSARW